MVNGTLQCERIGKRSLQKTRKEKGGSYGSKVQRRGPWPFHKMRSMDSTGEKHIVLCIQFQYPASKVRQAGDLRWDWITPSSQTWGSPKPVRLQGPPPIALCSASSNIPAFSSLCSNHPNFRILGSLEVKKRELLICLLVHPSTPPPGSDIESGEKHNLDPAVVLSGEPPSGLRVWREINTHKNRIKESRSIGIATQRGGWIVPSWIQLGWKQTAPETHWERVPFSNSPKSLPQNLPGAGHHCLCTVANGQY